MPIALPNLYCTPQDIYEYMGVDAAQLRLDDQNQASGQQVQASGTATIGATSISVASLQYPLLRGARLVFSDAGMSSPVEVTLDAAASVNATSLTVVALTSQVNGGAIAIDNGTNVWLAGMMTKAAKYGTARVKLYCCNRYDDSQLVLAWSVNNWATITASHWLAKRCLRAAPEQIQGDYEEAVEELKAVRDGELCIEDIGTRTSGWPVLSNVTVDPVYTYRKVRVEQVISEQTVTQYPQAIDWNSVFFIEW